MAVALALFNDFYGLLYENLFTVDDVDSLAWGFYFSTLQIVDSFPLSVFGFRGHVAMYAGIG